MSDVFSARKEMFRVVRHGSRAPPGERVREHSPRRGASEKRTVSSISRGTLPHGRADGDTPAIARNLLGDDPPLLEVANSVTDAGGEVVSEQESSVSPDERTNRWSTAAMSLKKGTCRRPTRPQTVGPTAEYGRRRMSMLSTRA